MIYLGCLLVALGFIDLALYYGLDIDLTGFQYSPQIALTLGWLILQMTKGSDEE